MARDISLNSQAWCNLVFQGKNKEYGAYDLRKTSSQRHLKALLIVMVIVVAGITIPTLVRTVVPEKKVDDIVIGPVELTNLTTKQEIPEENQIKQLENVPPPPVLKASIQFTPPVIKEDTEVTQETVTQDELTEKKNIAISVATVEGPTTGGTDIADLEGNKVVVQAPKEEIFEHVEQMPMFLGGQDELMKFLVNNIKYPVIAAEQGIQGTVILRFIVGTDGSVSDIQVVRGFDPSCDKEAKRVLGLMPNWIPGKQNGRAVKVYFTVPVKFRLQESR